MIPAFIFPAKLVGLQMMHVTFRDPELEVSLVGAASQGSWTTRKHQTRLLSTTLVRNSQVLGGSLSNPTKHCS